MMCVEHLDTVGSLFLHAGEIESVYNYQYVYGASRIIYAANATAQPCGQWSGDSRLY